VNVLVDSSVWIEYLRDREGPEAGALKVLIARSEACVTDAVVLELLAGPTDEVAADTLQRFLSGAPLLHQQSPVDAEHAAAVFRTCRRSGFTPRSRLDCLVAAVAIRNGVPVLHRDRDFDVIARHTDLQVVTP
jgi:predicted nucleic acid-binding protein